MDATAEAYPRPDFVRTKLRWTSLDGPWDFAFDDKNYGLANAWYKAGIPKNARQTIEVPYVFQSPASGINKREVHEVLWYQRTITDPRSPDEIKQGDRVILRFGAVDYLASVWVDAKQAGGHRGGHVPWELDITTFMTKGPSMVTVRVQDSAGDVTQPRGKQYWGPKPREIYYTPSSGIWQSVWLEIVPPTRIADSSHGTILRTDDISTGHLVTRIAMQGARSAPSYKFQMEARLGGVLVRTVRDEWTPGEERLYMNLDLRIDDALQQDIFQALPETALLPGDACWRNGLALWAPEHPLLYEVTLRLLSDSGKTVDEVITQVGMRSLDWAHGDGTFRLNGKPLFQRLCLDQGYWPETLMTPPAPASKSLKDDIVMAKAMGFNGCRKHQKVEDPRFLYWADKLGYLVWGEMANGFAFNDDYVSRFDQEWMSAVKRDVNHACIITWTPVNESWGYPNLTNNPKQRNHIRSLVYNTKTYDPTRPVNDNCGWEHVTTDLTTYHEYADAVGLGERSATAESIIGTGKAMFLGPIGHLDPGSAHRPGAPILCTEYGGVNIAPPSGASGNNNRESAWGYTTAKDADDLLKRIERLTQAIVEGGAVCGLVYTQLTDIEQEENGLYTYDRRPKLEPSRVRAVFEQAEKTYFETRRKGFAMEYDASHSKRLTTIAKPLPASRKKPISCCQIM